MAQTAKPRPSSARAKRTSQAACGQASAIHGAAAVSRDRATERQRKDKTDQGIDRHEPGGHAQVVMIEPQHFRQRRRQLEKLISRKGSQAKTEKHHRPIGSIAPCVFVHERPLRSVAAYVCGMPPGISGRHQTNRRQGLPKVPRLAKINWLRVQDRAGRRPGGFRYLSVACRGRLA
jgi:hypothetical protein